MCSLCDQRADGRWRWTVHDLWFMELLDREFICHACWRRSNRYRLIALGVICLPILGILAVLAWAWKEGML